MLRWVALAGALVSGTGAAQDQHAAPPSASQPTLTVQQAFDQASALDETGTPAARLAAWESLEPRMRGNKRNLAVVRLRKARALAALGRRDEAVELLGESLANLPAGDPSLLTDRVLGLLMLGKIAEAALDYPAAIEHYRAAGAIAATPSEKLTALLGLIKTETFVDPAAAARSVADTERLVASISIAPDALAELRRLDAERLLNAGDSKTAQAKASEAVKLLGGLTMKTGLDDVRARSDVAIAALLNDQVNVARQYLAMTGAGRLPKGPFAVEEITIPDCGGEAELKPADMAVIEFSIADDGRVLESEPVYSAGGGRVALEFARMARTWFWDPNKIKEMPVFYRYRMRVEMRCSTGFERPSIFTYLNASLASWLSGKGIEPPAFATGVDAAVLDKLREQLRKMEPQGAATPLPLVPVLLQIASSPVAPRDERFATATRADDILARAGAPASARLAATLQAARNRGAEMDRRKTIARVDALLADPAFASDPEAKVALQLFAASVINDKGGTARARLQAAVNETGLAADNPLRAAAWAQFASLEQASGNTAAAREAFVKSGLDATQCALVDQTPRLLTYSTAFPQEALMWGFEGINIVQGDIDAEGKFHNDRIVFAYPAFVFDQSSRQTFAKARFAKSYRPDGGLGCGGSTQRIRYMIPH
ncbi:MULTISPECIES: hypothetical protein [unclassified Sphingomonas]|uniref:hypothetical protein n=1 Tax=unclassified Sphingomonas TaxID=196159 RepID=UPI001ACA8BB1|nr:MULTISPECIES: hypothetical protein [unclassified Sphingomonas]MBN8848982.1 hypothetical protein [Sphingomonas sp.]